MGTNKTLDYGDLRITMTSTYTWAWDDSGSGATRETLTCGTRCIREISTLSARLQSLDQPVTSMASELLFLLEPTPIPNHLNRPSPGPQITP